VGIIGGTHELGRNYLDDGDGGVLHYELRYNPYGIERREMVDRTLTMLKSDAVANLSALRTVPDPLTLAVGNTGSINYGSGWQANVGNAQNLSPSLQTLTIQYFRDVPLLFGDDMPANVTLTCATGLVELKYKSTTIHSWATGRSTCDVYPLRFSGLAIDSDRYRLILYANGSKVNEWVFNHGGIDLDPENILDHRLHWVTDADDAILCLLGETLFHFHG